MNTINNLLKFGAVAFILIYSSLSSASIIPPLAIDFRGSDWASAYGQNPFTVSGVTVKAVSTGETNGKLYQDSADGLGIKANPNAVSQCGYEADEIDSCEKMRITLASNLYLISDIWITDLFTAPDGNNAKGEVGKLKYNTYSDATWNTITFFGNNSDQANGEQKISFGSNLDIKNITLWVPNPKEKSEFSVAGLVAHSVPEPTPFLLMGLAILGLGAIQRRKK